MRLLRALVATVCFIGCTPVPGYAQSSAFTADASGADVIGTVRASMRLTGIQHALRVLLERKTRAELTGPFFGDYRRATRVPRQWSDGDSIVTNYVGHPVQGAASGFIWLAHDSAAPLAFTPSRDYWSSRLRATAWAAGYSVQFEVGPFSEASIGNVGLKPDTVGWVDHVVTPAGGLAVMVGEDALDRFVIGPLERRVRSPVLKATLRMMLNPSRASANIAALRAPWHRADRQMRHTPQPSRP